MALAMNISGYALITGGGSGIGRATALLLAREGASGIALADLNQQQMDFVKTEVEAAATRADFSCITIVVDVVDRNSVEAMVETTVKAFGRLDYAVNSAGIGHKAPAVDTTASDWDNVIAINLTGVFTSMQEELRQMLRQAPLVPATYVWISLSGLYLEPNLPTP
jgi:NAD(P)-dependent dehydrogenase (short-subunit alcohol dehydrogenase family)